MKKTNFDRKHLSLAILVAILTIPALVGMAAADPQTWHWWDDAYPGTAANDGLAHQLDANMSKVGYGDSSQFVNLTNNQAAWWYAENPAQVNVSFGDTKFQAQIYFKHSEAGSGTIYIDVYSVKTDGTLERRLANGSLAVSSTGGSLDYDAVDCNDDPATSQTVLEGDRLAVRVKYVGTGTFQCGYNGPTGETGETPSRIIGPYKDPGYPVPELSTIILMSTGLLALMGYVVYRRRNNKK